MAGLTRMAEDGAVVSRRVKDYKMEKMTDSRSYYKSVVLLVRDVTLQQKVERILLF